MVPDRHVVLIGLPGAGKTSVGRHLAGLLRRPFADADQQLELAAGTTIPRLVRERGDDELHRWEQRTVTDLVRRFGPLVIVAPGGLRLGADDRELLARAAVVVWIRGPVGLLATIGDPTHRPRLADGADAALTRLEAELAPVYGAVADHVVDVAPFHAAGGEPRRAIAHHVAGLLGADVAAGTDDERPAAEPAADPADLGDLADLVVDLAPFRADDADAADTAVAHHIADLLRRR